MFKENKFTLNSKHELRDKILINKMIDDVTIIILLLVPKWLLLNMFFFFLKKV